MHYLERQNESGVLWGDNPQMKIVLLSSNIKDLTRYSLQWYRSSVQLSTI